MRERFKSFFAESISTRLLVLRLVAFSLFVLVGCNDNQGAIDYEFIDDLEIVQIDTLTIRVGTINMDSVITQSSSRILAGSYFDPELGKVVANSYSKVSLPREFIVSEEATFISLKLKLELDYYYGDAEKQQELSVHRILEEITPPNDNNFFYNFDSFELEEIPLGSITIFPEEVNDTLSISLSNDLGEELLEAAKEGEEYVLNAEDFEEFFKGIAIVGDKTDNSAISGFTFLEEIDGVEVNTIPVIELTYNEPDGDVIVEKTFDFTINSNNSFSSIQSEKPTRLQDLKENGDYLSSSLTNDLAFIQSGVGLMTRVEFPTARKVINNLGDEYSFIGAELIIKPMEDTYEEETPLPNGLIVYVLDDLNVVESSLVGLDDNLVTSSPRIDDEFNKDTYYNLNITSFIDSEINSEIYPTDKALLISTSQSEFSGTVNRLVIGNGANKDFKMYLNILVYRSRI